MVCWSRACSLRVENFDNCTSGMPVSVAKRPRAVEKCGVKQRLKKIPCVVSDWKNGVVLSGLPLMLLLYMLNDSQSTSTILGGGRRCAAVTVLLKEKLLFCRPIHSRISGK